MAEIVRDGFNGFVDTPFSREELSEMLYYLRDNPCVVSRVGKNGR